MRKMNSGIKKIGILLSTAGLMILLSTQPAKADSAGDASLAAILTYLTTTQASYFQALSQYVQNIYKNMVQLGMLATSFLSTDNNSNDPVDWSTNWSNEQNWLASLSSSALNNEKNQYDMQKDLLTTFFGSTNLGATPPVPINVNDLTYTSMLGQPLITPDPRGTNINAAMNYLTNASGLGLPLTIPSASFRGSIENQKNYKNFYNTLTSVQTYNAFVLSRLYEDSQSEQTDSGLRVQLIAQSSNSNWFSSVIANDLGWVLRQILLYTSQNYVLMDQLVQTQKHMLATLAMTNTLVMTSNEMQGDILLKKAEGAIP